MTNFSAPHLTEARLQSTKNDWMRQGSCLMTGSPVFVEFSHFQSDGRTLTKILKVWFPPPAPGCSWIAVSLPEPDVKQQFEIDW